MSLRNSNLCNTSKFLDLARGNVEEDMLEAQQDSKPEATPKIIAELSVDYGQYQNAHQESIVLEMNMIHHEKAWRENNRGRNHKIAFLLFQIGRFADEILQRQEEYYFTHYDGASLENNCWHSKLSFSHKTDTTIFRYAGRNKKRQEPLEVRKERGVIKSPLARVL
ncbi:hypothetical protein KL933_002255 [Ogataea haglerorum]|uniref:Uncharacterized protein n=1 Tax=Ogataea haglerorum TaxID=1937702 RepID=A0AAN6D735_9ASCO|nr:uncharacterized protein KL911_002885 [Ogataea haglerorum]KAG7694879.1 hypothetical protein KL951_004056 [Ogataea haglerorum]KAG7704558.1 hypothetical protein KL914_003949 [Ogataea haglerorum]KAG7705001.1 hypothetical protein KL950_004174 [Ogataea haglerorum]KAG7728129.1 hypothetical protein KL933_002255 [Ogataea haglerorum]KAG7731518.1 hypothetical protein KL948_003148 [Ogataea haglerorum]